MDYIDTNYAWQKRIQTVFKNHKSSAPFPYATELGVEFNPVFKRHDKISLELLTNGVIIDIDSFTKSVSKSAYLHLLDILDFNFDLGVDTDGPLRTAYALKLYWSIKKFKKRFKTQPMLLQEKVLDIFRLPDTSQAKTESFVQKSESEIPLDLQLNYERKGDPLSIKKASRNVQLSMDYYPLCKSAGVAFVLRPSNAPAQKLNVTLLTVGMMLEMLDFARILSGSYFQMLKELISHNFGEVYEPCYLTTQVNVLSGEMSSQPIELRESFCKEQFKFMLHKLKAEKASKRPYNFDSEVIFVPEKRLQEIPHSSANDPQQEEEMNEGSYMCPMEFEQDFSANTDTENDKSEELIVDIESEVSEFNPLKEKLQRELAPRKMSQKPFYLGFKYMQCHKNTLENPFPEIFCKDTLPMDRKTVKQKEWTRRTDRIKYIFNKPILDMFTRCVEIGLDFNVGSGRKQNLDMNLLTNHTLFEVQRFSSYLNKSVTGILIGIIEKNFKVYFQDEAQERSFIANIIGKEKSLLNHSKNDAHMTSPAVFPLGHNLFDVIREQEASEQPDDKSGDDISNEYPYCKSINLNLWSLDERPFSKKLDLSVATNGVLHEFISFARRMSSNTRELCNDVLEHNFDVDLQDPASEDSNGLTKWLFMNKSMIKKPYAWLKSTMWLIEVVSLKQYSQPNLKPVISEIVEPIALKPQDFKYDICERIGLDLNVNRQASSKPKLNLNLLTRGVLFEVHNFVKTKCNRYVPALYEILDYNFDLSSQRHRRVELAWSIAAQVLSMVRKGERNEQYMQQVFELPFESTGEEVCKEESEEKDIGETELDGDEVVFVQKLIPVDIAIEIE